MTIKRIWLALGRQAVFWAVAGVLVCAAAVEKSAWAESSEPPSLETIKSSLDAIELPSTARTPPLKRSPVSDKRSTSRRIPFAQISMNFSPA